MIKVNLEQPVYNNLLIDSVVYNLGLVETGVSAEKAVAIKDYNKKMERAISIAFGKLVEKQNTSIEETNKLLDKYKADFVSKAKEAFENAGIQSLKRK